MPPRFQVSTADVPTRSLGSRRDKTLPGSAHLIPPAPGADREGYQSASPQAPDRFDGVGDGLTVLNQVFSAGKRDDGDILRLQWVGRLLRDHRYRCA